MSAAFEEWVKEVCAKLELDDGVDTEEILEVARDVAHGVERRAAPVTTFLIGLAAGRAGGGPEAEAKAAATVKQLVAAWSSSG